MVGIFPIKWKNFDIKFQIIQFEIISFTLQEIQCMNLYYIFPIIL